ncbi:NRAMP family metal ion transporter [Cyberlindnera jadinii NRRL Y-1542]|uniref:Natural resistance-associated macrophage protein n=1 Tax=Cyberlindnera jadinii (strain ATCC 18201 / CBS 1600 / BCRC 20928 / JCM 3617 / NBRC 0987 / NRRL Y-1542) TaxID=983966 RepID=A0A1E4RW16_CYBJN|nr:natural resistance-associated macrophage protein [Cyberlindnera jadinii NRRL Y-1542]ODV71275.1 natural resistance-associated macrophage protein [Cyberlindnera jadinii NRRL Y-1542]
MPVEGSSRGSTSQYLSHKEVFEHSMAGGVRKTHEVSQTLSIDEESTKEVKKQGKMARMLKVQPNDHKLVKVLKKYLRFVGPGLMISVAYMDPGNYATDVQAGATAQFSLLFIILLSNLIAIFLQSLCIKLGSVTGLDLSRACREFLPRWLNLAIWFFAECAIIATDVAEVIGTAIALNVLMHIPLPAGVVITVVDVIFVLMAYRPGSSLKFVRLFEYAVAVLVMGVVICFCVQLAMMPPVNVRDLFRGFAPSHTILEGTNMYTAVSILGATVMPHSLFLGSGLVQPRLREFDTENHYYHVPEGEDPEEAYFNYKPTEKAIRYAMKYSIVELAITLFTFALFVNSAILIVSAASLYGTPGAGDADLYAIYDLLSETIAPAVGTLFMVALLFSGQSAGIVCTIAGQIVSEGHLRWTIKPWKRRIATRAISIVPCLVISLSIGRSGLNDALNASQVVLSILLPFLTAPLVYFTCKKSIMKVEVMDTDEIELNDMNGEVELNNEGPADNGDANSFNMTKDKNIQVVNDEDVSGINNAESSETTGAVNEREKKYLDMSNNWITAILGILVWIFISILNVYAIVRIGMDGI